MMDTCADYYSNLSGSTTSSSTLNSCIKGSDEASGAAAGGGGGGSANSNLSSFGSSTRNSSQSNVHPLLQHTTHPQHLIAPVAPQLATAAPPAAIVAPTITNHHPQQPNKFTLGNHGATGYSSSASAATVGAQSVVNGTSTGGHHNQATVYPLQHSHHHNQQHQAKNTSSSPLLSVDNLKTSVITENPYEYHQQQQQQQQLQHQQHHLPAHSNNYVAAAASGNPTHNLWFPTENVRSDHASVNSGYLDRGSSFNASCILSGSSVGGRLHGVSGGSVGGGAVSESAALEYNLNSYGESGGTNSSLVNYDNSIYQPNYGGTPTAATTSGRGVDGGPAGLSTTPTVNDSQSMADYQSSAGSNSSKCNYNSNSSPLSQTATSPFQQYTGSISQHQQQQPIQDYSTLNGGGGGNMHGLAGNGMPSGRTLYNAAIRSNHHPFDSSAATAAAVTGNIPLDYQHYPPSQQVDSVASLDAMTQRTYMDLSGSKPQSSPLYYPPSHAPIPQKTTKRSFSGYDDPGPAQYVMPENYYNGGYKAHANIHPHVVAPMPSHANQMTRAHYSRQGGGSGGGGVTGSGIQAPNVSQVDSKMYRRNYAKHPGVHLNYAPYHQYAGSNAAYSTDPLAAKRPPGYHPQATASAAGHQQMGYTDQQLYELESAKKKAAAYQSSTGGKYPYPSPGAATGRSYMAPSGPSPTSGQYSGMMQPGLHGNARPMCNYYPNGYPMNYPMAAGTHPVTQQQSVGGGGSVGLTQSPAMNGYNPSAMNGAEMYNHPNYLKSARHQMESAAAMAMGKHHNRNCYYDTNVPPAGEKTYVDLEDQISGSKITKSRVGYPVNMDYHHQGYYDPHYPPQNHPGHPSHPGMPRYNAKYPQERYLYYPPHSHPQLHSHYQQQQQQHQHQQQQHRLHQQMQPYPLTGPGHYSSHPQDPTAFHAAAQAHHQFASNGKKTNVRDFLSSWNDDEEEGAAPMGDGNYAASGHLNNLQRIQVGISIDKSSLMDSTGTMNLPDIIIDIEKQKPVIPEIDLTDDGNEVGGGVDFADTASPSSEEKLYVLESIDVPLSELNKYKHLNVINKLPENIVHLKEGGADGAAEQPLLVFNESEMIHAGVEPVTTTNEASGITTTGDSSGVENSLKFIEEIESSSDFKNDFELNVEYESFPNEQKLQPEVTSSTSPTRDDLKAGMGVEPSLAELVTKAEDMIARQRKESVIVAVKKKVKSESGKKKRLKRALKAQLREDRKGMTKADAMDTKNCRRSSSATGEVDSDSETVCSRNNFKSLVKCCLDRINSKSFRRNASRYLCVTVEEGEVVPPPTTTAQVLTVPHKHRDRQSLPPKQQSPKSLREICAETVISANLVTIHEEFGGVEDKEECAVALIPLDGQVPLLRDLCEQVLSQNNFIINLDDFYQMDNPRIMLADKVLPFEDNESSLDDNNNNHLPLISGLSNAQIDEEEEEEELGDGHFSSVDSPAFSFTAAAAPNPAAIPCHADAPNSDVEMSAEFDPYCDYFLAEPEDGDQIQFSEEVVPVDPDQHKRRQFADQMRLKYVHNNHNNHALDARRVLLKKYFYYQRHVAMVSRGMRQWRRSDRRPSVVYISVLRKQYRRAMLCRHQRWSKRSKTIRMEPMTSPTVIGRLPQLPMAISPRTAVSQTPTTTTTPKTHSKHSVSTAAANNETILKLIKEGIADMARKSVTPEDTSTDKSDTTQVIMVTVERARVVEERMHNDQTSSSSLSRVKSDLGHSQETKKEKEMYGRRKKERHHHYHPKAEAGEEQRKKRNYSETKYEKTSKESGTAKRWSEDEKNPSRTNHPLNPIIESKEESQPTTSVTTRNVLQEESSVTNKCARPKKKIKPKFDDILLGIDDMYKSSSTPPTIVSKAKPTNNNIQTPWKARKTLEIIELSDCSVSSPSSVVSSSTTSSSGSSSSSSSSLSSTSSSSSSNKSTKSAKTSNNGGRRSSDVPSSSSAVGRNYVSGNSNSARSSSGKKERVTEKSQNKPKVRHGGGERRVQEDRRCDKVQPGNKRKSEVKEKLIIKTAVVQLERNGYIDKLGKLFT